MQISVDVQASLAVIVSMATQESYLFHATVRDNLLYARPLAPSTRRGCMEIAARTWRTWGLRA